MLKASLGPIISTPAFDRISVVLSDRTHLPRSRPRSMTIIRSRNMRNCVARQKLQDAAAYHASAPQRHSRASLFFQSLASLTQVPWAAVFCNPRRGVSRRPIPAASRARQPHALKRRSAGLRTPAGPRLSTWV